ncbi:MAG TPA: hypothetical protein VFY38_13370 [Pseudonocardia sp.]|nr:hypothetical protein [Pseudonocardia sp.]
MALADALHSLLRLPGATYSCVVERDSGRVLAEVGQGETASGDSEGVVPYSVPRWGTAVAAMFDSTSGDELDDVMITGRRSYHLVRPIGPGASVLVYLRLDRSRSNLAAARRELATVRLAGGPAPAAAPAAATVPGARSGSDRAVPAARSRSDSGIPAARSRSDATAARSRTDAPAPATRSRTVAATPPPARVPAALAPPSTPARGVRRTAASASSGSTGTGSPRSSTDMEASRSTGSRSADDPSEVRTRSAPTTRQIPLPRRASTRSASDAGPIRQRSEAGPVGAVDAPGEPAPEGFAMPAVLGQSWARDPGTLRRLIAGLRRMT